MTMRSGRRSALRWPPAAERPVDLPLYVVDPPRPPRTDPAGPARRLTTAPGFRPLDTLVHRSARAHGVGPAAGLTESGPRVSFTVTRYLLAPAGPTAAAFDAALRALGHRVRTGPGTLVLGVGRRPPEPAGGQLRVLRCRLWLRTSPVAVPVELELLPLGDWRAVLHLRLARRFVRTMGWHRRWGYFAAGNATVDRLVFAVVGRLGG